MPIVEFPNPDDPLDQGDILQGISLYITDGDWSNAATFSKAVACLVLSRPCVATNKPKIIVAAIDGYDEASPKEANTFSKVLAFLEETRDGRDAPDCFYLGQIPALGDGRFRARLDSLHTVTVPKMPHRTEAIRKCRVARLCHDFRRDLHARIFSAFSSLGFDDVGWFSDTDLEWLISAGEAEEFSLRESMKRAKAAGKPIAGPSKQLDQHISRLSTYRDELARRKAQGVTVVASRPQGISPHPT